MAFASPVAPVVATENMLLLGKYRLLRRLGRGGMGDVWLARNEWTDREFALKLLLAELAGSSDMHARFLREAKISGRVRHPGVVQIFDVARAPELDGAVFMVMEVLDGVSLHELMVRQKRLPLGFLLDVTIAIADALGALHERGVVHRDLKPSNIFLHHDARGRLVPKVLDFGISKVATASDEGELTRTGAIIGSPRYMSPEQAAGRKDVDARADVHGLGVTLWTCAAGCSPFDASNYNTMIVSVIASERPRLRAVVPSVPESVSEVVARAIERDREARHANGRELARALEAVRRSVQDGSGLDEHDWSRELMASSESPSSLEGVSGSADPSADPSPDVSVALDAVSYVRTLESGTPRSAAPAPAHSGTATTGGTPASRRLLHQAVAAGAALMTAALLVLAVCARTLFRASAGPTSSSSPPAMAAPATAPSGEAPPAIARPLPPSEPFEVAPAASTRAGPSPARALRTSPSPRAPALEDPHHGVTSSGL